MVEGSDPPCKACPKNTYTPSGVETSCHSCPTGKTVPSGQGASISDCTWGELYVNVTFRRMCNHYSNVEKMNVESYFLFKDISLKIELVSLVGNFSTIVSISLPILIRIGEKHGFEEHVLYMYNYMSKFDVEFDVEFDIKRVHRQMTLAHFSMLRLVDLGIETSTSCIGSRVRYHYTTIPLQLTYTKHLAIG